MYEYDRSDFKATIATFFLHFCTRSDLPEESPNSTNFVIARRSQTVCRETASGGWVEGAGHGRTKHVQKSLSHSRR